MLCSTCGGDPEQCESIVHHHSQAAKHLKVQKWSFKILQFPFLFLHNAGRVHCPQKVLVKFVEKIKKLVLEWHSWIRRLCLWILEYNKYWDIEELGMCIQ